METIIEFKNFKQTSNYIAADLFISGDFIVRFSDDIKHVINSADTNLKIYDYFRKVVIYYINQTTERNSENLYQVSNETH